MHKLESIFLDFNRNPGKTYVEATVREFLELKDGSFRPSGDAMVRFTVDGDDLATGKADAKTVVLAEIQKDERFAGKTVEIGEKGK